MTGIPGPAAVDADVAAELVDAALHAADKLGRDVADVPVVAIAAEAGISRSTLLRRLGGSRVALDAAVRAAGVDPGGQAPVRVRALDAAAALISESGLAATTLDAVAARAGCSVYSLHAVFGGRDELLRAMFERHSPVLDVEEFLDQPPGDLAQTVPALYRVLAHALNREPRVAPAMFAEAFSRPTSPAVQSLFGYTGPRVFAILGRWFDAEIRAGRMREQPTPLLVQQLLGPIMFHLFTRPATENASIPVFPDVDTVCGVFAENFLRAVTTGTQQTAAPSRERDRNP